MKIYQRTTNIVLVGNFNPSVFDKYFFATNDIFSEKEISEKSIFSPEFAQVITDKYWLLIMPNQIQLMPVELNTNVSLENVYLKIIKSTDLKILQAGINFTYNFEINENITLAELTKKYFYNESSEMASKIFNTSDSQFGMYLSKSIDNCRLKLDIKPVNILDTKKSKSIPGVSFQFNFHLDLISDNKKEEILNFMSLYGFYDETANSIIKYYI